MSYGSGGAPVKLEANREPANVPTANVNADQVEDAIIGTSAGLRRAIEATRRVAPRDVAVLIQGETGSGKERMAHLVHLRSGRPGRFVAVNCAAFAEELLEAELFGHEKGAFTGAVRPRHGLFEQASGGTLFLDEVGEMSAGLQAKLLRVLQEGVLRRVGGNQNIHVDVRVVSATHRDLRSQDGFRSDLYFRLAGYRIVLPPLRDRGRDVVRIARHLLLHDDAFAPLPDAGFTRWRLCRDAEQVLLDYRWPGNVRELRNVLTQVVVDARGARIRAAHIEAALPTTPSAAGGREVDPDQRILDALAELGEASRRDLEAALQLSKSVLNRRLARLRELGKVECFGGGTPRYRLPTWQQVGEDLDDRSRATLELVTARGEVSREDVGSALGVSSRTANRLLGQLVDDGVLETVRRGRAVLYRIARGLPPGDSPAPTTPE